MGIQEIETAITKLSVKQLIELSDWLEEYQARVWDQQIEDDPEAGRLDKVLAEADAEYVATRMTSLEIPYDVIHTTRMTQQELRQELALYLFQRGKLSFGKAREMTGMDVWAFQQLLGSRGIPVHYDVADYEDDLAILRELERL